MAFLNGRLTTFMADSAFPFDFGWYRDDVPCWNSHCDSNSANSLLVNKGLLSGISSSGMLWRLIRAFMNLIMAWSWCPWVGWLRWSQSNNRLELCSPLTIAWTVCSKTNLWPVRNLVCFHCLLGVFLPILCPYVTLARGIFDVAIHVRPADSGSSLPEACFCSQMTGV